MTKDRSYSDIKECFRSFDKVNRLISEITSHDESKESSDAIPYSTQDEVMSNITQTAKTQFGADFSQSKTPMLYYPEDGDIVLSGTIGSLNNAKFQFRYKDSSGNGCYIWTDSLQLTDETIKTLSIINGVYKNWKKELSTFEDVRPMEYKNKEQI